MLAQLSSIWNAILNSGTRKFFLLDRRGALRARWQAMSSPAKPSSDAAPADRFDYLVVGGGAAGAVLARSLAGRPAVRVGLLEAGPSDEGRPEVAALERYREVAYGPLSQQLAIAAPPGGNPRVVYPTARVLGGCTAHNSGIWFRAPASDFVLWERLGARGWGPETAAAGFDRIEARVGIERFVADGEPQRALYEAARQQGFPAVDFAAPFAEGVGWYRFSKAGWRRRSASAAYLHPLAALPANLTVLTDTPVERLLLDEAGAVTGVRAAGRSFAAAREVILAAGAFGTPRLLLLSGLGPPDHLQALGIPVRQALPGVGEHLIDHPAAAVNAAALRPVPRRRPWNYACVLFARTLPDEPWPDIEMQLGPEPFEDHTRPAGYPTVPHGFCAYFTVNRAVSEGRVRLTAPDPAAPLLIAPGFLGDPAGYDLRVMRGGVRLARRLLAAPPLAGWAGAEAAPGAAIDDDAALDDYLRRTVTTGYHPAGTCRMGAADDPRAVVGPDLRVRGVRRLRIADASVFPAMVSVNIAATCMLVGLRCADLIAHGA
jgi:choline dehydrogenase-like flavoprotein